MTIRLIPFNQTMIERTLIRVAMATRAAWWLARVVFSRSTRQLLRWLARQALPEG
jgi:hypothetical protein